MQAQLYLRNTDNSIQEQENKPRKSRGKTGTTTGIQKLKHRNLNRQVNKGLMKNRCWRFVVMGTDEGNYGGKRGTRQNRNQTQDAIRTLDIHISCISDCIVPSQYNYMLYADSY